MTTRKIGPVLLTAPTVVSVLTALMATLLLLAPGPAGADDAIVTLGSGDNFVVRNSVGTPRLIVDSTTGEVQIDDAVIAGAEIAGPPNQGDLWYDNGSGITRLAPGTAGQFLQTLGSAANPAWASAGLRNQVFLATGTFTAPAGVTLVFLFMAGGGGGGQGGSFIAGDGGGGGGMVLGHPHPVTPGADYVVVVGSGGNGGALGLGNDGGPSSFDDVVVAPGGNASSQGGGGFSATGQVGGGISLRGGFGFVTSSSAGGGGGGTLFGLGGNGATTGNGFPAAANSGGGGGGGSDTGFVSGGAGGSGVVIVLY